MNYGLLWLAALFITLLWVAALAACIGRLRRKWMRVVLMILVATGTSRASGTGSSLTARSCPLACEA